MVADSVHTPGADARDEDEVLVLPASFAQERLWFLDRFQPDRPLFNIPAAFRLRGRLDVAALKAAVSDLVARHETLRTTFEVEDGRLRQVVAPPDPQPVQEVEAAGLDPKRRLRALRRLARREARTPFDLTRGPLLRVTLVHLADDEHALLLTLHHIIADGWSMRVIYRDLEELYQAHREGEEPDLPELPIQYADYADWERRQLQGEALEEKVGYWRRALDGAPRLLELPTDHPRPSVRSHRGGTVRRPLPSRIGVALAELAGEERVTVFMVLAAAYAALLARHCGRDDLVFGTAAANRNRRELERLVGYFVSTVPLRVSTAGDPGFRQLVGRVREAALGAFAHQDLPFERLVEELVPERSTSHTPLLQVMLLLEEGEQESLHLPEIDVRPVEVDSGTAKYDLAVSVTLRGGRLTTRAVYGSALFDRTTVRRLLAAYETLLAAALADPDRPLSRLPVLDAAQRHQVLRGWNDTAAPFPADDRLHRGFERRAATQPDAPALLTADAEVSYGALEARANHLAHHLRALGVGPNSLVGVHLQRTPRMIETVLAVHKAGGAYVPLETTWPAERIRWIVAENGIATVVAEAATLDGLAAVEGPLRVVAVDGADGTAGPAAQRLDLSPPPRELPDTPPEVPRCDAGDLAYVIFTSGSTGRPKGVMVRHRPAVNLLHWVNRTFDVGSGDRLLFVASLAFDLSVYDVFGTLAAGGAIRLASSAELADPQRLVRILRDEAITFWDSAPAALLQCVPYFPQVDDGASLRLVFLSGDWVPLRLPGQVREVFPSAELVALGGATEATIWSNVHRVGEVDPEWASIPYGRPIANARYHVLDTRLQPLPIGVPGDLYIAGEVVSTGYAGKPRQTAIQYRPDPYSETPGGRLYATGDRARYGPDGVLEFLGRLDTQVKVRGYRIELGEIEAVLGEHPALAEAVVLVREDRPGHQRLVAYYRRENGAAAPDPEELAELAATKLPGYMVPSAWVEVHDWPLSPTGKLDRGALPAPETPEAPAEEEETTQSAAGPAPAVADPAPPASRRRAREEIAAVWAEVLERDEVAADATFFDQGGNSLLLAQVHARLQEVFARDLPMVMMFRHATVTELAEALVPEEADVAAPAAETPRPQAAPQVERTPAAGTTGGPIAVVGMAGRFPGARNLDELWSLLDDGREGIRFFSDEELLAAGVDPARLDDDHYVKGRGALEDPELFDAAFFELSPRDAQILDPQQRHFLEVAWEALEDAGRPPGAGGRRAAGDGEGDGRPRVGVFAGVSANDYDSRLRDNPEVFDAVGRFQILLGNQPDYLATRLAYKLDLTGPALTVLTACSTSLVAVHLACRALAAGECDLAVAGGASVQSREVSGYPFLDGGIDSPDGHTRAFDADAAGSVAGSGCGAVVLKRLDDALADGDPIRAVVRGTAVNNDGARKVGFTAPSVQGQAAVIRAAQRAAGVEPASISYLEAHGTATPMGDPIEIAGLKQAWSAGGAEVVTGACPVGSVKSNLGHLDAAAGVAGLIKTVLALQHERIPPSLHFRRANPELGLDGSPFRIAAETVDWRRGDAPRRAGVSSFGIGGTNAHLVIEEAPAVRRDDDAGAPRPAQLLLVSARTAAAAGRAAQRLAAWIEDGRGEDDPGPARLADAAYTLDVGRRRFSHRRAVVARGPEDAVLALREPHRHLAGEAPAEPPSLVFMFSGQGAQYPGMGGELYAEEVVFRDAVDRCCELLGEHLDDDLRQVLYPPAGAAAGAAERLTATELAQPALFTVCWALAELLASWGLEAEAAVGHSVGEYVAAARSGVFDLADALALVAARGRMMGSLPPGDMLAVGLDEAELAALLEDVPELALAVVNGPGAAVVSGPAEPLAAFARRLEAEQVDVRPLHTSHAFHSPMMEPILEPFAERVASAAPRPPRRPFVSNLTGTWITDEEATDPAYWARHLRSTVRFAAALDTLLAAAPRALVEVGPGRVLTTFASRHPRRDAAAVLTRTLPHPQEDADSLDTLLAAVGRLWTAGVETDAAGFWAGRARRRVALPTYPFERRRYWYDGVETAAAVDAGGAAATPGDDRDDTPREGTETQVAAIWRDVLGVAAVGRHDDFFELGGSSLTGVGLASRLGAELEVELPGSFLLEAPTVAEMAALVDERRGGTAAEPASCLVRLQRGSAGRRALFLVHQVGGHVFSYRPLAGALDGEQPLFGLRSRGLEAGEEPCSGVGDMAAHYLELLRAEQPRGPYLLGGASMGGMVAWEMARRLDADGEPPALLVMMDTPCGEQMPRREDNAEAVSFILRERTGVALDGEALRGLPFDERWQTALDELRGRQGGLGDLDVDAARRQAQVLDHNVAALYAYEPQPLPLSLVYFRAAERRPGDPPRPELPWIELARGGCETVIVAGDHESMHEEENVGVMARVLAGRLALAGDERCRRLLARGRA